MILPPYIRDNEEMEEMILNILQVMMSFAVMCDEENIWNLDYIELNGMLRMKRNRY